MNTFCLVFKCGSFLCVFRLYKKKAFLHWYYDEGMDEDNFEEAAMKIADLIHEYQDRTDVQLDFDDMDGGYEPPEEDEDDIMAKYLNDSDGGGGGADDDGDFDPDEFQPPGGGDEASLSIEPWD